MRRGPLTVLAAALAAAAPAAWALEVEGRYKATPEADCAAPGQEDIIRIEGGVFHGPGGSCKMLNPVDVRGMNAQLFDMECEGAKPAFAWTERALFMEGAEGGLILAWNGYAFRYERCSGAAGSTTASDAGATEPAATTAAE